MSASIEPEKLTGMSTSFRKYLKQKIKLPGKHVRTVSDEVIPSLADGWNAMCHVEDGRVWEPLDPRLWQEVQTNA
ncbi:MAG: hypothetical protein Q9M27_06255 [Mariprofundaceae bacterium]|nr:hypothetical protein [Mariprofundaceae bacterium]